MPQPKHHRQLHPDPELAEDHEMTWQELLNMAAIEDYLKRSSPPSGTHPRKTSAGFHGQELPPSPPKKSRP